MLLEKTKSIKLINQDFISKERNSNQLFHHFWMELLAEVCICTTVLKAQHTAPP